MMIGGQDPQMETVVAPVPTTMDAEAGSGGIAQILQLSCNPSFEFLSQGEGAAVRLAKAQRLTALEFTNVSYTIDGKQRLFKVSGKTRPGEVLTIVGPPLAGKTKLLAVLAGSVRTSKSNKQILTGEFFADGQPMFKALRTGFVARSDAIFSTATVEEELRFNANLRLPAEVTAADRQALVDDLMKSLGLEQYAKTMVKKLKPAEKKRLAIGIELCACPNALFVDEPTTNLDTTSAWEVMCILNALAASRACIVVCSLQNPPSTVFGELTQVLLLGQGRVLFSGHASELNGAFERANLHCPANFNPVEFALVCARTLPLEKLPGTNKQIAPNSVKALQDKKESVHPEVTAADVELFVHRPRHRSAFYEFGQLLIREILATKRDPKILIGRVVSTAIIMALSAVVFLHVGDTTSPTYFIGSEFASFVFPLFSGCFGTLTPTVLYISETRPTFVRERSVNVYGTMPYLMSRLIPELVVNFIVSVLIVLIMYWAALWNGPFILLVVIFYLVFLSCISWAYLIAFAIPNVGAAVGAVALIMVPQLLFMGVFVRISTMPIWLQWISYLCNVTYALRLVGAWEFDQANCDTPLSCAQWKAFNASNYFYAEDVWWYIVVLLAFWTVLRTLAFLVIRKRILSARRFGEL